MDEFTIIKNYFTSVPQRSNVLVGIGDDCAVVEPPEDSQIVMSIDTMVEGVHFPVGANAERVGARAMSGALSDLAAMGAHPLWFTLALTMPDANTDWLDNFSQGLLTVANLYECSLIGGDTTRGPLTVTIQVHGAVRRDAALKRSGANPGDMIYVTGSLGDGAAALAVINQELTVKPESYSYLLKRFYMPTPKIREGEMLASIASSAIDISDGLYADLGKICDASGTGALIDVSLIPTSTHWSSYVSEGKKHDWVLSGGDDYQLCFTVPRRNVASVEALIEDRKLLATSIGKITDTMSIVLVNDGNPYSVHHKGYDHFGDDRCE